MEGLYVSPSISSTVQSLKGKLIMKTKSQNSSRQKSKKEPKNLEEFNQMLFQHPEVKKALKQMEVKAGKGARKPIGRAHKKMDSKAPKLLRQAMANDARIGGLAQATSNMMKYNRELNALLEEKASSKEHNLKKDKAFAKKWSGIEKDYRTMIKGACGVYRENPFLMASGKVLAENPDDL